MEDPITKSIKNINNIYQSHFGNIQRTLTDIFHCELIGVTGAIRIENTYKPWGQFHCNDKGKKEKYQTMLKHYNKNKETFLSSIYSNQSLKIPYLIFSKKEVDDENTKNATNFCYIDLNNPVVDKINNKKTNKFDYIYLYTGGLERKFQYPIDNLEFGELPDFEDKELSNKIKETFTSIFTPFHKNFDEFNLRGFFNATSLLFDDCQTLIYAPFKPIENYTNGSLFLYLKNTIDFSNEDEKNNIDNISWVAFAPIISDYTKDLTLKLKKQSIKSAIAAIMSRNMSHNLGSHVMYYTRQELLDLYDEYESSGNGNNIDKIKGLAWYLHYMQERQDFIANIVNDEEFPLGVLNLKQDVIDELTPDATDWRHNVSAGKCTRNYLLRNIVKSEKISRHDTNRQEADADNSRNIKIVIKYKDKEGIQKKFNIDENYVPKCFYDINFSVKGGQLSRHAFLVILENIIRNSAKHGFSQQDDKKDLIITIDVKKEKDKPYIIKIFDNAGNAQTKINVEEGKKTAFNYLTESIKNIRIVDDNNKIVSKHKGLKEMLTCVLWLKGTSISQIEEEAKNGVLQVVNEDGNIAYQFELEEYLINMDLNEKGNENKSGCIYYSHKSKDKDDETYLRYIDKYEQTYPRYCDIKEEKTKEIEASTYNSSLWESLLTDTERDTVVLFERDFSPVNGETSRELLPGKVFHVANEEVLKVKLQQIANKKCIVFKNHFAASSQSIQKTFDSQIYKNNPNIILENLSGANQAFNLLQKFQDKKRSETTQNTDSSNPEIESLFYRVVQAYLTKIVIVDERLSFYNESSNNETDEVVQKLLKGDIKVDEFMKKYLKIDNDDEIKNYIQESINKEDDSKIEEIYTKKNIAKNTKEKMYENQNTLLLDMNKEGNLYNSTGMITNNQALLEGTKFFSIHLGLLDKYSPTSNKENSPNGGEQECKNNNNENKTLNTFEKLKELIKHIGLPQDCFISIHSGRGGFNEKSNEKSNEVRFISLAVLQKCLEDSKYSLAEMFYNTKYIPFKISK